MKRFTIGMQIGRNWHPSLEVVADKLAGGKLRLLRYDRIVLRGQELALEVPAKRSVSLIPYNFGQESEVEIDLADVESHDQLPDEERITLRKRGDAHIRFYLPNPLSPCSQGYWFSLRLSRIDDEYYLRFNRQRNYGIVYYRVERIVNNEWNRRGLLRERADLSIDAWVRRLAKGFDLSMHSPFAEAAAKDCVFLRAGRSGLVDSSPYRLNRSSFSFRAEEAPGHTGEKLYRLVTKFSVPAPDAPALVRDDVLRLDDARGILDRSVRTVMPLKFECASLASEGPWCLDWRRIPTGDTGTPEGTLSFRYMWHALFRHYNLGLRAARSQTQLSFVPTDVRGVNADRSPWTLRFRVALANESWQARLVSMHPESEFEADLEFGSVKTKHGTVARLAAAVLRSPRKGESGVPDPITVVHDPAVSASPGREVISLVITSSPSAMGDVLVNGVELSLGRLSTSSSIGISVRDGGLTDNARDLGDAPASVRVHMTFDSLRPRPVGEDPERGASVDGAWLNRELPLVVDLVKDEQETLVEINEQALPTASRSLQINVRAANPSGASIATDAVVLDPNPLRVARVVAQSEAGAGAVIATYRHAAESSGRWDFATKTGEFRLALPPQVIGEEAIKAKLTVRERGTDYPVPFTDELFDFRLSPPAQLTLDRTALDTSRAPAPWSLRRILDRREGEVGLELLRAEFELLYGMTTVVKPSDSLRIADQDALLGRIPFPSEMLRALYSDDEKSREYTQRIAGWIRGLLCYPAQTRVFRDWASRSQLVIDEGVSFRLRKTRQTSNPFRLEEYHHPEAEHHVDPRDYNRLPLRGGFDFGFESEKIYDAIRTNEVVDAPERSQGSVEGLVFGSLGGSGHQHALFDEGRSIVISATTHGRLDSLTLVRVGRIAMLWNHARHVIVYERTTRTAPRYKCEQPGDFEGLAALRKVREYIEITQPSRAYPDVAGSARRSGPLIGSFFESVVIPVRSSWGHDIPEGWVIPLAGPVPSGLKPFYPRPNAYLEFARAEGKGGKVSQRIETPQRLIFFTSTRGGEGSNPDAWASRADVDFPVTSRLTAPQLRSRPSFAGSKVQPEAQQYDYGLERFTVGLAVGEDAANLMHGRAGGGTEARIRNVSLARGRPQQAAPHDSLERKVGSRFAPLEAELGDAVREVVLQISRLASDAGAQQFREFPSVWREALSLIRDAHKEASELQPVLANHKEAIGSAQKRWGQVQQSWTSASRAASEKFARERLDNLLGDLIRTVANRISANDPDQTEVKSLLRMGLDGALTEARGRLERFAFVADRAFERLSSTVNGASSGFTDRLHAIEKSWTGTLNEIERRFDVESPHVLEAQLRSVIDTSTLDLGQHVTNLARDLKDDLGPLFADLNAQRGPLSLISSALEEIHTEYVSWVNVARDELIPPFELGRPNWDELREQLSPTFLLDEIERAFEDIKAWLFVPFREQLKKWQSILEDQLDRLRKFFEDARSELEALIDQGHDVLIAGMQGVIDGIRDGLIGEEGEDGEDGVVTKLTEALDPTGGFYREVIDELEKTKWLESVIKPVDEAHKVFESEVIDRLKDLEDLLSDATKPLAEIAEFAESSGLRILGGLRNVGERIEGAVVDELREVLGGAEDEALELVRALAEGPVTESLRCTREWVGYYYDAAQEALSLTPAAAMFNDLGLDLLNPIGIQAPFDRLRERILTELSGLSLGDLFPDFGGLKLEHLFEGFRIPEDPTKEYDWIDLRHGFDKDHLRAWSEVKIDREFAKTMEVFDLSPIKLRVKRARFRATSRVEAGKGGAVTQKTSGEIAADWIVELNGQAVLTMERARLFLNESGDLDFDFDAKNLRLAPAIQFVTDALSKFLSPRDGMTITPVAPGGLRAELSLPLPDIGTGAFTMTGVTLYSHFELLVVNGFEVATGLWLSRPDRPFGIAILFLGGGGWFGVDVRYRPPRIFETRVSIGVSAGAMVAVNFGVARGSAGVLFTVGLDFYRNWTSRGSGDVVVSVGMLIWGEFSILGIASAYMRLVMGIEYRNGSMTGYGRVSVSIKICWCFTLRVDREVRKHFAGSENRQQLESSDVDDVRKAVEADLQNSDW